MSRPEDPEAAIQTYCRELYGRTRELWQSLEGKFPTWQCRFSILYGPPWVQPDLLILGSNPGFDPADIYDEEILTWPTANEYTTRNWRLATKLRSLFASAGLESLLERSVGTNQLFFKSKSLGEHESGLGWANNDTLIRNKLEVFCVQELDNLIRLMQPKLILALGLSVFDTFADKLTETVSNAKGRRIAAVGFAKGTKVVGIIHPTGARVSNDDWDIVARVFVAELKQAGKEEGQRS